MTALGCLVKLAEADALFLKATGIQEKVPGTCDMPPLQGDDVEATGDPSSFPATTHKYVHRRICAVVAEQRFGSPHALLCGGWG